MHEAQSDQYGMNIPPSKKGLGYERPWRVALANKGSASLDAGSVKTPLKKGSPKQSYNDTSRNRKPQYSDITSTGLDSRRTPNLERYGRGKLDQHRPPRSDVRIKKIGYLDTDSV